LSGCPAMWPLNSNPQQSVGSPEVKAQPAPAPSASFVKNRPPAPEQAPQQP